MSNPVNHQFPEEALRASSIVMDVLGNAVVGVYLFGSAVIGGLRVHSDVDVLVIVSEPLSEATRRELVTRLMSVSGKMGNADSVRPLEVTVLNLRGIKPWRYPPSSELVYGEWLRKDFEDNGIPQPEPDPDIAIVLTKVRKNSIAMRGPEVHQLLDPVPTEHFKLALAESLPRLLHERKGDERNVLLTLARVWMTAATGEIVPKDVAAAWAMQHLPKQCGPILDLARRAYLGEIDDSWDDKEHEVGVLVCHMEQAIEACLGQP